MEFKNLLFFFLITLPVCILARFLQLIYIEDPTTGFFNIGYEFLGYFLIALIIIACAVNVLLSFTAYKRPPRAPRMGIVTGICSLALGVSIGFEILTETFTQSIRIWQIVTLDILGIFAAVFFLLYGLKMIINYPLPKIFFIVPALYWIMRLICIFTSISAISLIVDNFITLASHCLTLIFMANFAKLNNDIDDNRLFRKLIATGFCSVIFCAVDALPRIIFSLIGKESYIHSGVSFVPTVLLSGIFIISFFCSYFSKNNFKTKTSA